MTTRFETFAYLPPLSPAQAQAQADDMLQRGLIPTIEFAEGAQINEIYWQTWPIISTKGQQHRTKIEDMNASLLMMQVNTCGQRHPYAIIRLSGYNRNTRQTEMSFIVKTPDAT